ncbi:twin-arginine translocase subunit TatC [Paenibacillus cymbidii]|uniref:twin-arginine translocase subunit TatC n=1 Tax=Paenibacillus cymbidii TaxID=1639034 RepID=UPI001081CDEB|nr:twin-arginine translocase subunit TatC [Paenibacillus cymbidii]
MKNADDMSLVEHLTELRKRIMWVLAVLVVTMIAGFFLADPLINYIKSTPPADKLTLHALSPWDSVRIYMQFSFVIALIVTLPFTLYQLWSFVKPGLRPIEQRATIKYIPLAVLLFLIGLAFSYFVVFRMALLFTGQMSDRLHLEETYGISQYFTFMFNILIPISLLFELPVVVMFLTAIRLLTPKRLRKFRRFAYFILMVISAIVTPPDVMSALIVMAPLVVLYEASIAFASYVHRKQLVRDQAWEEEYGAK